MRLVPKLTFVFVLGTSLVLGAYGYSTVLRENALFSQERRDDIQRFGARITGDMQRIANRDGLEAALAFARGQDLEDRPIRSRWIFWDARGDDPYHPHVPRAEAESAPATFGTLATDANGDERYYYYFPLALPGGREGALEISRLKSHIDAFRARALNSVLAQTALAALVSAAVALAVGRFLVGRPIDALMSHARRVGGGELDSRLLVRSQDELGELAHEMNVMCDRLSGALVQLRRADRLATVGQLAAGIAHELGTPLNIVGGRATMIASLEGAPAKAVSDARIIVEESQRMEAIIRQLLDFARPRSPVRAPQDLVELARRTCELLAPLAEKKDVKLEVTAAPRTEVEIDAAQIEQALTNLVVNAIHAMRRPGTVRVAVSSERAVPPVGAKLPEAEYASIAVRDEGEGISPENLGKVFEPFFTTKDVGEGTGLGLSVAYGIVREHGGWIGVESAVGKGSVFSIHVPRGASA